MNDRGGETHLRIGGVTPSPIMPEQKAAQVLMTLSLVLSRTWLSCAISSGGRSSHSHREKRL